MEAFELAFLRPSLDFGNAMIRDSSLDDHGSFLVQLQSIAHSASAFYSFCFVIKAKT
ncbi:uncharacterized protein J3R85_010450 [Psidium guajava]|nr:uncharacterized protein J3R85_010450 [Psidium guajava]